MLEEGVVAEVVVPGERAGVGTHETQELGFGAWSLKLKEVEVL